MNLSRRSFVVAGAAALLVRAPAGARASRSGSGVLLASSLWPAWRNRFMANDGRVVDDGNAGISHSEGQGYGMLLAQEAGDRDAFEAMRTWTKTHLLVRDDALAAWRFDPAATPPVTDRNNATDGDLLIAWALLRASLRWDDRSCRLEAGAIARAVQRRAVVSSPRGPLLLPGAAGFRAGEREDGPVVNLSYWVFPAFADLAKAAPEYDWSQLTRSGVSLVADARFGTHDLPADWTALGSSAPRPAKGFPPLFGWNALRVPLYLAWSGAGGRGHLAPFARIWGGGARPVTWNLLGDVPGSPFGSSGYDAVPALVASALNGASFPPSLLQPADEPYYPATLRLLSALAVAARYPACL